MTQPHFVELSLEETEQLIAQALPATRRRLGADRWWALVRDFCSLYYCCEPELHKVAEEVLDYLDGAHRGATSGYPGWLCDLAHYEWLHLALRAAPAAVPQAPPVDPEGDLLQGAPVLSHLAWLVSYDYPVRQMVAGEAQQGPLPQAQHLLLFRDRNEKVHVQEPDAFTAQLLERIEADPELTGAAAIATAAEAVGLPAAVWTEHGAQLLASLRRSGVLIGSRVLPTPPWSSSPRHRHLRIPR